jgi:hypothetical protein
VVAVVKAVGKVVQALFRRSLQWLRLIRDVLMVTKIMVVVTV